MIKRTEKVFETLELSDDQSPVCPRTCQADIEMVPSCGDCISTHALPLFATRRTLLWGKLASGLDKVSERAGLSLEGAVLAGPAGDVLVLCAHCATVWE